MNLGSHFSHLPLFFIFQVALKYSEQYGSFKVRVLTFVKNRGKGGAVRLVSIQAHWVLRLEGNTSPTDNLTLS